MRKFNLYINGSRYNVVTEEELLSNLKKSLKEPINNLDVGESHFFTSESGELINWEIERVI
jgi:hypothetical protein